ncbi:MAG: class I SAM-dependent methyltransferase [Polyangiaceae bacterium]
MSQNPGAEEWASSRGEKWLAQMAGMEAMLAPVHEPLFEALNLDQPLRMAEVGSGGGGTAIALFHRAPSGSIVKGLDISPALVDAARKRLTARESGVSFDVADMSTAKPDAPYDRLYSRFGVMFFEQPEVAFASLLHWLKPQGRLAFAVWGPPTENHWIWTVRNVVDEVVGVPAPNPDAPGPFRYGKADKLVSQLVQAGFSDVRVTPWNGELPIGGGLPAERAAEFALSAFSTFGELLSQGGDTAKQRARELLVERYTPHEKNGETRLAAHVNIFTAQRAS